MGIKSTTIQKQYAYTGKNIGKLSSSMLHSIRHSSVHLKMGDDGREIKMWNADKSSLNYIIIDGSLVALDSFSDEQKEKMVFNITEEALSDLAGENRDIVLENEINDLTKKVKKKASNLKKNKDLFTEFADMQGEYITDATLDIYKDKIRSDGSIKRVEQKLKPLENFQKQNNELVELQQRQKHFKLNPNQGLMQESFLKFPKLKNGTITPQKHTEILMGFYNKFYPSHDIKGAFFHGDEESLNESSNDGLVDCGGHPHVILSCKSNESGKYDLIKKQKQMSIDYIKKNSDKFPQVEAEKLKTSYRFHKSPRDKNGNIIAPLDSVKKSENREMSRYLRAMGIAQQEIMLDYAQEKLKPFGIELYRNEYKSKADKKRLLQLENDKNLPKHLRVGNSHNAELDKETKILEHKKSELKMDVKKYEILIAAKTTQIAGIEKQQKINIESSKRQYKQEIDQFIHDNTSDLQEMIDYCKQDEFKDKVNELSQKNDWFKAFEIIDKLTKSDNKMIKKAHKFLKKVPGYEALFSTFKDIFFNEYETNNNGKKHELDDRKNKNKLDKISNKLSNIKDDMPFGAGLSDAQINKHMDTNRDDEEQISTKVGADTAENYIKRTNKLIKERYKK